MLYKNIKKNKGFTLIETIVGVGVFLVIATASYQAYVSLFTLINQNQYKVLALNLANEQFEIIRNLPFSDVGIQNGIPNGKIPHVQNLTRGNVPFVVTTTIRNIDLPFDGQLGSTTKNDLSPADNKSVDVEVSCPTCKNFTSLELTTTVAPKNLETASTNGALVIKVFDSNGVVVPGAAVNIVNSSVTPNIVIDDVTDNDGILQIVDAPPGTNVYQITVTKSGYSTDKTYTTNVSNPAPTKPHASVVVQQITQISFSIDRLASLAFSSVTTECVAVPSLDFNLAGEKTIGAGILKYSQNLITNASGIYSNPSMESDSYTVTGIDGSYDIVGINPLNPISLDPNTNQSVSLIVAPKNANSLVVTVKDNATQLPITGATVRLTKSPSYDQSKTTGRGSINQTDWSGGSGQSDFSDVTKYFYDDGNIGVSSPIGELKLKNAFGNYNPNGVIESSTIDTGSASNFYNIVWSPTDQPVPAGANSVRFQFATNASSTASTTWSYKGPDGTSATYYTSANSPLSTVHNGDRYARYKVYLSTATSTSTPNISDTSFTVTSACTPPGQVVFSGLSAGTYNVEVTKSGFTTLTDTVNVSTAWQEKKITLSP